MIGDRRPDAAAQSAPDRMAPDHRRLYRNIGPSQVARHPASLHQVVPWPRTGGKGAIQPLWIDVRFQLGRLEASSDHPLEGTKMATATAPKNKGTRKSRTEREQDRQVQIAARLEEAGELVSSINQAHQAVVDALEKGLVHALKAGEYLSQAKKLVGHGKWAEWVENHCEFSYRTARSYLRVYNKRDHLPKRDEISYRRALLMLRADPTKKPGKIGRASC